MGVLHTSSYYAKENIDDNFQARTAIQQLNSLNSFPITLSIYSPSVSTGVYTGLTENLFNCLINDGSIYSLLKYISNLS